MKINAPQSETTYIRIPIGRQISYVPAYLPEVIEFGKKAHNLVNEANAEFEAMQKRKITWRVENNDT